MYLIQLLLPLYDNEQIAFGADLLDQVRCELTDRFGGATAFLRSPAEGFWEQQAGKLQKDEVVIVEVMAVELDQDWWRQYREELEQRFRQEELVIRSTEIKRL